MVEQRIEKKCMSEMHSFIMASQLIEQQKEDAEKGKQEEHMEDEEKLTTDEKHKCGGEDNVSTIDAEEESTSTISNEAYDASWELFCLEHGLQPDGQLFGAQTTNPMGSNNLETNNVQGRGGQTVQVLSGYHLHTLAFNSSFLIHS